MKAMIFAAGRGTRLGEITARIPKALIEINGKTALQIAVEKVTSYGFSDIIVNLHHHPDKMRKEIRRLKNQGYNLTVSDESDRLLETGGGLYKAQWFFDDELPFLLYNVDILTNLDISDLYNFHCRQKGIATLAVMNRNDNRYYFIDNNRILTGWCNIDTGEEIITRYVETAKKVAFTGIHIVNPLIFRYMNDGVYSMTDLYIRISGETEIYTYEFDGRWLDLGTEESLREAWSIF
ncbi:MAG: nucleotidyltransferase family protein [Bacteroidales bacterium]